MSRVTAPPRRAAFTLITLLLRNLRHHWRTQLAIGLAVFAGATALTGALLVGDSMRGSLRELALLRLDGVTHALRAPRLFPAALADRLSTAAAALGVERVVPVLLLQGSASQPERGTRFNRTNIIGADERFWHGDASAEIVATLVGRGAALNQALADELGVAIGQDVLVRLGRPTAISSETLLGRRDDTTAVLRLTVRAIVADAGRGGFSLAARQAVPRNLFVPLNVLQQALGAAGSVNALLLRKSSEDATPARAFDASLDRLLREQLQLADYGLRMRVDARRGYVALESDALLLDPAVESAARAAAGQSVVPILSYLANEIAREAGDVRDHPASTAPFATPAPIPYSTVVALDPALPPAADAAASQLAQLAPGEIMLNDWTAHELAAQPGDRITLAYYVTPRPGLIEARAATFTLRAILPLAGAFDDPGFVPEYPGLTDTRRMSDWDPPFPIDLKKVRDRDEQYWDDHRTTPKAFIHIDDGRRLWSEQEERFGRFSGLRIVPPRGAAPDEARRGWEQRLLGELDPSALGMQFQPAEEEALAASGGNTDFGGLFIGFSFFLIVSGALLVGLIFRLGVEQRAAEVGLLLATGFSRREVRRLLLAEGLLTASLGCEAGLAGAMGYAWLMLSGLRGWWADAVHAPFLTLHVSPASLAIGLAGSMSVALLAIALALRGVTRHAPRALLAGVVQSGAELPGAGRQRRWAGPIFAALGVLALALAGLGALGTIGAVGAFFGAAVSALVAGLGGIRLLLRRAGRRASVRPGRWALARLAWRGAARRPARSLTTISLLGSASFLIVSLAALRLDAPDSEARDSGTGGFALVAEAATALPYDLSSADGRERLGLAEQTQGALRGAGIFPLRLRAGDDSSCLSLYRATRPRILGAPAALIERGGFRFAAFDARLDPRAASNPWRLLAHDFADGAIPVIGDEAAVRWQLHRDLGQDLIIADERGSARTLRFVALLSGSMLQDELIVADADFTRLFPSVSGQAFFLIEAPRAQAGAIERALEHDLGAFSLEAGSAAARLAEYLAVQNTYLATFQTLGGLGLVLGAVGLAAVALRSIAERRRELALLLALGYRRRDVRRLVFLEHAALIGLGLLAGVAPALVALAPLALQRPSAIPWLTLAATLALVLLAGLAATHAALRPALRAPLVPLLRGE